MTRMIDDFDDRTRSVTSAPELWKSTVEWSSNPKPLPGLSPGYYASCLIPMIGPELSFRLIGVDIGMRRS